MNTKPSAQVKLETIAFDLWTDYNIGLKRADDRKSTDPYILKSAQVGLAI